MIESNTAVWDEELREKPSRVLPALQAGNRTTDDDDLDLLVLSALSIPVVPIDVAVDP